MTYPPRQPRRDELPADEREWYDALVGASARWTYEPKQQSAAELEADELAPYDPGQEGGATSGAGYYGMLAHSPRMAAQIAGLGALVRAAPELAPTYSQAEGEWVPLVLAKHFDTPVLLGWGVHLSHALSVGVRADAIAALRSGREEELTGDERQLTEFIRAVVEGRMTAELWLALERRLGERGVVEYTMFVCFELLTVRLQQAIDLEGAMFGGRSPVGDLDRLFDEYRTGSRELLAWAPRVTRSVADARLLRPPVKGG